MLHQYFSPNPKSKKKNGASIKHKNLFMSSNNPHNSSINVIPENFFFNGFQKRKGSIGGDASLNLKTRKTKRGNQQPTNLGKSSELKHQGLNRNRSLNTNNVHLRVNRSLSGKMRNFYQGCNLTENYLFCDKSSHRSSVKEKNLGRTSAKGARDKGLG